MKKQILILLVLLFTQLLVAQVRTYNVGILVDVRNEKIDSLLVNLKTQIKTVVGKDAIINFSEKNMLVNDFDFTKAKQQYNQLVANETDIILAFGIVNNELVIKQETHKKPTVLFGAINKDFNRIDLSKNKSDINNLTYLVEEESYKNDLKKLKELTNFKNVGIIIDKPFIDMLPIKATFDAISESIGTNYTLIPFESVSDITSKLDTVDAVYMAGGFFLSDLEIATLSSVFIEKKLPSFTINNVTYVEKGFMATNNPTINYNQILRRLALTVEQYINGTPLAEIPVFVDYKSQLTINYNTAELTNVAIKYSLINTVEFVGKFDNVLSEKKYNLLELIEKGLHRNLALKSQEKEVVLRSQDVKTAKSNYLPSITANAGANYVDPDVAVLGFGQTPEFQTSGNITLQQTIFSETANATISIQKNLKKAQQENFNAIELNTVLNISNVYFNTLILKANAQIQKSNLDLTKRNLKIAEQNFNLGQSSKSDVLRFNSQMAQNNQAMIESVNQLEQGFIALNQLLNNPIHTKIDVDNTTLGENVFGAFQYEQFVDLLDSPTTREMFVEFLIEEARKNAPELKALGYNLSAAERSIQLNGKGRFLPTVQLQGQYNSVFNRNGAGSTTQPGFVLPDNNYTVGVAMSIPIFNRNQTNINRKTALIQKDQLNILKENTEQVIDVNVRNSILNVINQISNIELSKISEQTAKEALELTQVSYASGAVNVVQLIDAQNNYINTQLASATAVYGYLVNMIQVERFIGHYFLLSTTEDNSKFTQRFIAYLNTKN
ncbi:TolC family protein [Zobellia laminariae]|uniref:TolC family protein n=1 Tax=Zobellia laminariae TaxID=248906 RepID=UPI003EF890D1